MANLQTDLATVLNKAIDAEPMKFVIVFLMVLVIYDRRSLMKFLDKELSSVKESLKDLVKTSETNVDKTKAMLDDHLGKLSTFQDKIRSDTHDAREDILKTKYELLQQVDATKVQLAEVKTMIAEYGAENSSVVKAMAEYRGRVETLEKKINDFFVVLQKRKESGA